MRNRALLDLIGITLVIGLHFLICIFSITEKSLTSDEGIHLVGGLTYWNFQDFRMQPENGNLPQRIAALPSLWIENSPLETFGDHWISSNVWDYSDEYLFHSDNNTLLQIFLGRSLMIVFSILLIVIIYLWSRSLWGNKGAMLSAGLAAFSPCIIANSRLMTSDMAFSTMFLLSTWLLWRALKHKAWTNTLYAGVVVGFCCLAKYSAVFLFPYIFCILIFHFFSIKNYRLNEKLREMCYALARISIAAIVGGFIIWTAYGWRYSAQNPSLPAGEFTDSWEDVLNTKSPIIKAVSLARDYRLLPEGYLYGFSYVYKHSRKRSAFFAGDYRVTGWRLFFPTAFIAKTTIPTLLACILAIAVFVKYRLMPNHRSSQILVNNSSWIPVLTGLSIVWLFAITSNINIGHRHILPTYPFLFILLGGITAARLKKNYTKILSGSLITTQIATCLHAYPNYISYFNLISGGSDNAHLLFVDSSLDWGQDLPTLREFQEQQPDSAEFYLSYFGVADPAYHGIKSRYLHSFGSYRDSFDITPLEPGTICISATMLSGVYVPLRRPTPNYSRTYQELVEELSPIFVNQDNQAFLCDYISTQTQQHWVSRLRLFQTLRFESLRSFLITKDPDKKLNHTIFTYELSIDDISASIDGFELGFRKPMSFEWFNNKIVSQYSKDSVKAIELGE